MEKFVISGSKSDKIKFDLVIPKAKHFETQTVFKGEKVLQLQHVINDAVQNKHKLHGCSIYDHIKPFIRTENGSLLNLPRSLQHILLKHPLPLSQGPVLLPLDTDTEDKLTIGEVLCMKTSFSHKDAQHCSDWFPVSIGGSDWREARYEVRELQYSLSGAASTRSMGLVYNCTGHNCVIHYPCTVCTDPNAKCKVQCGAESCNQCTSQCREQNIKLARLFNSDHYTLVTMKIDKYQFATPYAGIPLNCLKCSDDVLEHQSFHLVFHTRCRFCRQELQHFEQRSIETKSDYKSVDRYLQGQENRTCSFCLKTFFGISARRKHEENVHQGKDKLFKCDLCVKTYSNSDALKYHKDTKHKEIVSKFDCSLCGLQFSTERNLLRHGQVIHSEENDSKFECAECGKTFSRKDAHVRHEREKHHGSKANLCYVEDLDSLTSINCAKCSSTFKRRFDLKRHQQTAHGQDEVKQFKCPKCEKTFARKFALNRHIKTFHQ